MAVYLEWVNPNKGGETEVFRSASTIDKDNPGTPIVTFNDDTSFYNDPVPKVGDTVFYLIRTSNASNEIVFSREVKLDVTVDTGPGPSDLMWGDTHMGYFGRVSENDLGIEMSLWGTPSSDRFWYKIMRKGKILFIASPLFNSSKNANALIAAKVFNTGITSAYDSAPSTGGAVMTIRGRRFAPRIAKMFDDGNTDLSPTNYSVMVERGMPMGWSEWTDILRFFWTDANAPSRFRVAAPFRFGQTAFPSAPAYPFLTSDYFTSAKTTIAGFNGINTEVPGMAMLGVPMNGAANSCAPIVEYLGAL